MTRVLAPSRLLAAAFVVTAMVSTPAVGKSLLDYVGQCVPFARAASGIEIYGDAWTWWAQAEGRYKRGAIPRAGSVAVFCKTARLPLGHVAVISHVIDSRVVMVTHANWSLLNGERGHAEQDVTLTDVSADNDWSEVRVWYRDSSGLGSTNFPLYGFIYPTASNGAKAKPAPELTSPNPDYIGALIDVYR